MCISIIHFAVAFLQKKTRQHQGEILCENILDGRGWQKARKTEEKNPTHPTKTYTFLWKYKQKWQQQQKRRKKNNKPEWLKTYEVFIEQKSKQFQ